MKKKITLKQNIIYLLLVGWLIPVLIMTVLLATYVDNRARNQAKDSISASLRKAVDYFELELAACETASKNASYYSDIREAYVAYIQDRNEQELNSKITNFLNSEYKYNAIAKSAILVLTREDITFYTYNNSSKGSYKDVEFFVNYAKKKVMDVAGSLGTRTKLVTVDGRTYLVRNLMRQNFTPYAMLAIEINSESLLEGFESVWGYSSAAVLLDGEYMMGERSVMSEAKLENLRKNVRDSIAVRRKSGVSYALMEAEEYALPIEFVIRLDNGVLYRNEHMAWIIFGLMAIFMIPLVVFIFRFFRVNVTTPIDIMVEAYDEIGTQNYGYQIETQASSKEFDFMQDSFNKMSHQIKEQFDQIYKEEIALRDAKIMALQSQINPHFLNNTFEIINWEARLNGNIKVSKMIEALSTMLEATMNRRGESLHSLSEELSYVDAYAYIISERLGDKFSYTKDIDDALLSTKVPKLIIQPIVENAVEHGISQVAKGNIRLRLFAKEHYIFVEVRNDGMLSDEDKAKIKQLLSEEIDPKKERSLNLGIRNVNNRIRLIYGDDCGLFIDDNEDGYTYSTILFKDLPILEQ